MLGGYGERGERTFLFALRFVRFQGTICRANPQQKHGERARTPVLRSGTLTGRSLTRNRRSASRSRYPLKEKTLTRSDFSDGVKAGPFSTAIYGTLRIEAALLGEDGEAMSSGMVRLPLQPDNEYSVTVDIGESNPIRACLGCQGSKVFAIDPDLGYAPTDSLFIVGRATRSAIR
ncbi:MAG: hypothetical protein BRD45_06775 [Bacteroidetes bacterium QS_8_64_10]|nr:MAG: hypothetical protein BRD45_06775 [Bacteroidetes bacterium QS_8_64_10]